MVVAAVEEAAKKEPASKAEEEEVRLSATERALRGFTSDNGGDGVDDVLADIIGYTDDLRNSLVNLGSRCAAARADAIRLYGNGAYVIREPVE